MSSPVKRDLEAFLAGRIEAQQVVIAAAVAYYRDAGSGMREALGPLVDLIDRASPGVVELASVAGGPGLDVRLVERGFPARYEDELRAAAQAALRALGRQREAGAEPAAQPAPPASGRPGVWRRLLGAVHRLFSTSA
jgi:hypothetical protein